MTREKILAPRYNFLIEPTFLAIRELGGSATNDEIRDKVIDLLNLPDDVVDAPYEGKAPSRTDLEYQLAWARTYLKRYGAIENTQRGVWMITPEFSEVHSVDAKKLIKNVALKKNKNSDKNLIKKNLQDDDPSNDGVDAPEELEPWKVEIADVIHNMNPFAFERLAQLLLRECGFSQVIVTKKTGDGGIDGTGKLKINGIFSFNVAFQCKRYTNSVSAKEIRDFRGALTANIEKGVFITTGTFTKAAREEASDTAKQQIDLIDGEEFIDKLIEYRLGIHEKNIYEVDKEFFKNV